MYWIYPIRIQYTSSITVTSICINLHITRTSKIKNNIFPTVTLDDYEIEDQ